MKKIQVTSSLTKIYRTVLPTVVVAFNVLFIGLCIFYFPSRYIGFYIVVIPFFLVASGVFIWPLVQLKEIFLEDSHIEVRSAAKKTIVRLAQVTAISRFAFYFFMVEYSDTYMHHRILVMPKFSEFMMTLGMGEIESFRLLRERVAKSKQ